MTLDFKRWVIAILGLLFLGSLLIVAWIEAQKHTPEGRAKPVVSAEESRCVNCHREKSPVIVRQWEDSRHAERGIGCRTCHEAKRGDRDGFDHEGVRIATIVSPRDCAPCHDREFREQQGSRHADAASFVGSLDNFLGEVVEGGPAAQMGCQGCHGTTVRVLADGRLDPRTWPNGGMGRINPDGSKGSCAACHLRHDFSLAVARGPETCGRCHMGPDHPQFEIYSESKHGVRFATFRDQMNLGQRAWVPGVDYHAAPTCATCHMSATRNQPATHDVGTRIAWTLRPTISTRQPEWEEKRRDMLDVCTHCHSPQFARNYFVQYDAFVSLYNDKFAHPAQSVMEALRTAGRLTETPFDENIEWTYYELWHHEGRRARMGAAMMGPDYVQWHGIYEVAKNFYTRFLPEAEALQPGITEPARSGEMHSWTKGLSAAQIQELVRFYRERYGQ